MTYGSLPLNMGDARPGDRIYLGVSGGLDSAYMAYRLLSDGYPLLLHHTTYRTRQLRYVHEEQAYLAVIGWLRDHGLDQFTISKSEYICDATYTDEELAVIGWDHIEHAPDEDGQPAPVTIYGWNLDYRYLLPEAGKQLHLWRGANGRRRGDIRHVIINSHRESRTTFGDPEFDSFWKAAEILAGRPLSWLEPMKAYDRTEILGDMPPDLIRLCWWCRDPDDGKPCHICSTCKAVDPALEANGLAL